MKPPGASFDQVGATQPLALDDLATLHRRGRQWSATTGVNGSQTSGSEPDSGAVYAFVMVGSTWLQQVYLKATNTEEFDGFGRTLALYMDTLVIGGRFEDSDATGVGGDPLDNSESSSGAVYVFEP